MFILKLGELKIKINNKYSFIEKQCHDYIINSNDYDFEITVLDEELNEELNNSYYDNNSFSLGYIESICAYRKICLILPNYNCMLLHAAVVKVDNDAYAFCAKSGTGKTTHTKLWQQLLGDRFSYINGDKPIIKIINGIPYAYGSPWCGKENYGNNTSCKLKAIAFIERDTTNSIHSIPKNLILSRIAHQILLPKDIDSVNKTFDILNSIIQNTKTYLIKCNMELEAAKISYNEMKK